MMDILSIVYFGPIFSFSLYKYLQMLQHPKTAFYPEMSYRLYMMYKHLQTLETCSREHDLATRCVMSFKPTIEQVLQTEKDTLKKFKTNFVYYNNGLDEIVKSAIFQTFLRDITTLAKIIPFLHIF